MPRRGGRHYVLVKGAEEAMNAFKFEIAEDLGLMHKIIGDDGEPSFKHLTTVEVGQIGGEMVRRIQAAGEWAVMQRYKQGEPRLMPQEVLPEPKKVREITNNGNMTVHVTHEPSESPASGQQSGEIRQDMKRPQGTQDRDALH